MRVLLLLLASGSGLLAQSPVLFFSDLLSGPATGGEGAAGAWVTLYGENLGNAGTVTISGVTASNYKIWGTPWLWYQKLAFQIPASAVSGSTTITVTTSGGSSNSLPFTINTGHIYFAATTGSDSSNGSFAAPFLTIDKCRDSLLAGDICYLRNGEVANGSDDYNSGLLLGTPGNATFRKAIAAYPGETATVNGPGGASSRGVYTCNNLSSCPGADGGSWWVVANLVITAYEAVSNAGTHDERYVGNYLTCPGGDGFTACFSTGEGAYDFLALGNNVGPAGWSGAVKEYHGMYFSTNANHVWVGFNSVHDIQGCRGINFHSTSAPPLYDLHVYNNLIYNTQCDGLDFDSVNPSLGTVEAYNNVIYNTGIGPDPSDGYANYTCIYVPARVDDGQPDGTGQVELYNNTLYNCGTWDATYGGAITSDTRSAVTTRLRNNLIYQNNGRNYIGSGTTVGALNGSNNLYFGNGAAPSVTTANVNSNPLFISTATPDFHLQSSSPAKDAGVTISGLLTDHDGLSRPQGSAYDMGAYEYVSGTTSAGASLAGKASVSGSASIH